MKATRNTPAAVRPTVLSYCSAIDEQDDRREPGAGDERDARQSDGRGGRRVERDLGREDLEGPVGRPQRHADDPSVQRPAEEEHDGKAEEGCDEAGAGRDERQRPRVHRRGSRDGRDRSLLRHRDSLLGDAGPSGSDPSHAGPGRAQSGSGEARGSISGRRLRRQRKRDAGTFVPRPRHHRPGSCGPRSSPTPRPGVPEATAWRGADRGTAAPKTLMGAGLSVSCP